MHSLTYTQKKLPAECRQQRCICLYTYIFSPHANSSGQTSGQKVKNAYTIYTLNIHFLFSKSAYTIYIYLKPHFQPAAVIPTAPSLLLHPSTSRQQSETDQTTTLPPHILQAYNAAKPSNHNATTTIHQKKVHTHPAAGIYIFFRPFFPLPSKRQTGSIHPTVEEKKRKRGMKRC